MMEDNSKKINIGIFGGGWQHNIGNAFIQMGSSASIMKAFPKANVVLINSNYVDIPPLTTQKILTKASRIPILSKVISPYLANRSENMEKNRLFLADYMRLDYIVLSGVWLSSKYLRLHLRSLASFCANGAKLLFNGAGGLEYTKEEIEDVRGMLKELRPYALISRDSETYVNYRDLFEKSSDGIDAAFFIKDHFIPTEVTPSGNLKVMCFDKIDIPQEIDTDSSAWIVHHSMGGLRLDPFRRPHTFFSETPDDYLNIYGNTSEIYSDRVHACLPVLVYGGSARLFSDTPRKKLFKSVGCDNIDKTLISLDQNLVGHKKDIQLEILNKYLNL